MVSKYVFSIVATAAIVTSLLLNETAWAAENKMEETQAKAHTTVDPYVPVEELELILKAFTKDELLVEAQAWQELLREKAVEIGKIEITVKRQNRELEKSADIQKQAGKTQAQLDKLEEEIDAARATGDADSLSKTEKEAEQAREMVSEINTMVDEVADAARETAAIREAINTEAAQGLKETVEAADKAEEALEKVQNVVADANLENRSSIKDAASEAKQATIQAQEATADVEENANKVLDKGEALANKTSAMKTTKQAMIELEGSKKAEKQGLLEQLVVLREQRTLILDNFKAVLAELTLKTSEDDSTTTALLTDYQLYVRGVQGIHLDVSDTTSSWVTIKGWLVSAEGGLRFAMNILHFIGVLVLTWLLSIVASRIFRRILNLTQNASMLLKDFLVGAVRWIIMIVGFIMALSALEVSIAPLLAMMGAAGFILALALQDSLSNFASGIMILFFKPFDVGDFVDAGGVSGKVTSVNLVSTLIMTVDNKKMLVPNNKIWRDVITNATGVRTRRVDLEFGIGYKSDNERVQQILEEIVTEHPLVLEKPEPVIRMHVLSDSSVNYICRPWVRSADYWSVYWDVTEKVKKRFDDEEINIAYPQRDVHVYIEKDA